MQALKTIVLAFALTLAGHAVAQEETTTQTTADQATRADDERMVCERRKAIGSNKVERICKTARQRQEEKEGAQYQGSKQGADRLMQTRNTCATQSCAGNR